MEHELAVLRAVRLKGRTTIPDVAAATGASEEATTGDVTGLLAAGLIEEAGPRVRLTPAGRERLDQLLEQEREDVDTVAMRETYERFVALNGRFKQLAADWQQRDGEMNDHSDAAYDERILDRLAALHERLEPVLDEVVALAPRLRPYPARLRAALDKIDAGDHTWFLRPIIDSYHTVWFELHEDLIGLCGLTREAEAASGRAE